jgi:Na+-translocating ferredoxin:NAD+ oxidoreductase subunit A
LVYKSARKLWSDHSAAGSMTELFLILVGAVFVNNFVLARFLGICPFLGVSKKVETALGMGMAVVFVMTVAAVVTWLIQYYVLNPFGIEYLQTIAFILVVASLVQLVEMIIQKASPVLYQSLGIFLPLITTNCAVLGVAVLNIQKDYTFLETIIFALGAAAGFTLAMVLFAGLRERLDLCPVPASFRGTGIALISAGLLSLAFMGFAGLVKG